MSNDQIFCLIYSLLTCTYHWKGFSLTSEHIFIKQVTNELLRRADSQMVTMIQHSSSANYLADEFDNVAQDKHANKAEEKSTKYSAS